MSTARSTSDSTTLVFTLADILNQSPFSVEIIPGSFDQWNASQQYQELTPTFPFLVVEGNIGVPQKVLYKVYMAAVALFKSSRSPMAEEGAIDNLTAGPLIASSSVILLANSAHQTALNMRKRLIQREFLPPQKELGFIAALLRGSHDCVKQSIVWDHRRWLFRYLYGQVYVSPDVQEHSPPVDEWTRCGDSSRFPNMPPDVIRKEFNIVSQACKKYPRNYHAWTHWHFCMETLYFSLQDSAKSDKDRRDYVDVLACEFSYLRRWVEQHVSDHSAVHQLCSLVRRFDSLPLQYPRPFSNDPLSGDPPGSMDAASSLAHAMSLLTSYPSHESLWMYLRGALSFVPDKTRREMVSQLRSSPICEGKLAYGCLAWSARQDGHLHLRDDSLAARRVIVGDPKHPQVQEISQGKM